jgi:transposase-like protein
MLEKKKNYFLRYPKEIRQFIYTTNQVERLAKEIKENKGNRGISG